MVAIWRAYKTHTVDPTVKGVALYSKLKGWDHMYYIDIYIDMYYIDTDLVFQKATLWRGLTTLKIIWLFCFLDISKLDKMQIYWKFQVICTTFAKVSW